jgi:nucleoside-diphosphate-sugar epimerase
MKNALIGHTGFVGGTLNRQFEFHDFYNSKNIESIADKEYNLVVCAGAPAEKWKANQNPEADLAAIKRLAAPLARVHARRFILISTVDVYPQPIGVDEDTLLEPGAAAYGRHRYLLEKFVQDHFDALVVRLPGLFGRGLKKNVIYDFLHENNVAQIDSRGSFQFYDLENLWRDLSAALSAGLRLLNVATEPVTVAEVVQHGFMREWKNEPADKIPARYDFRSVHAERWGGANGYLYEKGEVLDALRKYVVAAQARIAAGEKA